MKTIRLQALLAVVCLSCGIDETASVRTEGLSAVTCPAGSIPWNFTQFPSISSGESLRQSGGKNTQQTVLDSVIAVTHGYCAAQEVFKGSAAETCNGRTHCSWQAEGCAGVSQVKYTCSLDPAKKERGTKCDSGLQNCYHLISCPQLSFKLPEVEPKIACVPESCHGRTRRDSTLACVQDESLPVEYRKVNATEMRTTVMMIRPASSVPYAPFGDPAEVDTQGVPGLPITGLGLNQHILFPNTLYDLKMYFDYPVPVGEMKRSVQGTLTLWAYDVYRKGTETLKLFHCQIHSVDLRQFSAGEAIKDGYRLTLNERFVMPRDCLNNSGMVNQNVSGAARAAGKDEVTWLNEWGTPQTQLAASYGVEGEVILLADTTPAERQHNCAPNPSDFFYSPERKLVDRYRYLSQREIRTVMATDLSPSGEPVDDAPRASSGRLYFRPTSLTSIGVSGVRPKKLRQKIRTVGAPRGFLRVDVDWFMAGDTNNYFRDQALGGDEELNQLFLTGYLMPIDSAGKPLPPGTDGYVRLGKVRVFEAAGTGSTYSANYPITATLRDRFINPSSPLKIGDGGRNFKVRVCARWGDPLSSWVGAEVNSGVTRVGPYGTTYKARIITACLDTVTPMQIVVDNSIAPFEPIEASPFSDAQPAAAGDSRMSQQFDDDNESDCAAGSTQCRTESSQALAGGGTFGGVIIESNISATTASGGEQKATAQRDVKLLGFTVDEGDEEKPAAINAGKPAITFTIEPPWDDLQSRLNMTSPPGMKWNAQYVFGQKGLGLGWGIKVPVRYGPLQGDVIFSTSVSGGLSADITYEFGTPTATGCTGTGDECEALYELQSSMKFGDALNTCYAKGGRLGELSSAQEAQYVANKLPSGGSLWLGGQAANEFVKPGCVNGWAFAECYMNHLKYLRWLSNDEDFASSRSFGTFEPDTAEIFGSGYSYSTTVSLFSAPASEGVTMSSSKVVMPAATSERYPSVCKYKNTASVQSQKFSASLGLSFGAGFGVAFCTPSDEWGVCLEGSVTLVGVNLTPTLTYDLHHLTDRAGRKGWQSKVTFNLSWELRVLAGEVNVKVVFGPWFSFKYNLFEYSGLSTGIGGELASHETVHLKELQ